jgi:hypothetical protein
MKKMGSIRLLSVAIAVAFLAAACAPTQSAVNKAYTITFSTGTTATVNAGEDFVFAIVCQPPTDITEIQVSGGTLTAEKTTLGGPSDPQGVINGLWTLSEITGDVTITLVLNTMEGADLPTITTGKAAAEAAASSAGGMGGPGGGAPPEGGPDGAPPAGAPGGTPPEGAPPTGALQE